MSSQPTPEQLSLIRHSLAHLLAKAINTLYPGTINTIGPAVDTGFYYDFDFSKVIDKDGKPFTPSEKDFKDIEKKMRNSLANWHEFTCQELSADEARTLFADNPYKLELIEEIVAKGEKITTYTSGDTDASRFTDLCRGGHVHDAAKEIPADCFKLSRVAGAYWRGNEKNKMLTRIYGLAFATKVDLEIYEKQVEEAKQRDHKKIGKELGLFVFSELVGPGLPLWTPKGTIIRELLNDYVWELRRARGYQKVAIPHITKKDLYETSGHWKKYADDLFKIETREKHVYAMKPMNCPHHTQIFDSEPRSYRDMPQRFCETTMVYRDEQSGELSGLSRVLSITQDDAHVFCRESQVQEEALAVWDIVDKFYTTFGFKDLKVRFSRHDPEQFDKYLGTKEVWERAEAALKTLLDSRGVTPIDGIGEAAFYGPKLDFIAHDSLGRVLQVATIQLDFNMPERFNLFCINEKGEKEQIVMIHCAIMGSIERFMSTLIEHTAGNFPVWLAPTQVEIIPVRDNHKAAATELANMLSAKGIRAHADLGSNGFGKKVREAKNQKTPYTVIIGDKDIAANKVTLESRDAGALGQVSAEELLAKLVSEITSKK